MGWPLLSTSSVPSSVNLLFDRRPEHTFEISKVAFKSSWKNFFHSANSSAFKVFCWRLKSAKICLKNAMYPWIKAVVCPLLIKVVLNVCRRSITISSTNLNRVSLRSFFVPVRGFPLRHITSVHLRKANFSIREAASAIIALGSLANCMAVGNKCSFTNLGSWNIEYVSAYRVKRSNDWRLTLAHELFKELTKKLNKDLDCKRPVFSNKFSGGKILPLLTWCSIPPKSSWIAFRISNKGKEPSMGLSRYKLSWQKSITFPRKPMS